MGAAAGGRHFHSLPALTQVFPSGQKNVLILVPSFLCSHTTLALQNGVSESNPAIPAGTMKAIAREGEPRITKAAISASVIPATRSIPHSQRLRSIPSLYAGQSNG